jgi:hypothetical protein
MNDKAIRDILIAWLQATNHEIRIYQEKNIGSSICDVMAVTDKLTGYEIKSDLDNYARLEMQIHAYDRFFDENYLVVSQAEKQAFIDAALQVGEASFGGWLTGSFMGGGYSKIQNIADSFQKNRQAYNLYAKPQQELVTEALELNPNEE